MIFTDTITIYNHYKDSSGADHWKKTILEGVMYKRKIEHGILASGAPTDGRFIVNEYISITIPNRSGYYSPVEWKKNHRGWTLNPKSGLDIVLLGNCEKELSDTYRLKDLKRDMGEIGVIKAVHDNTKRDYLKHWRVIAV